MEIKWFRPLTNTFRFICHRILLFSPLQSDQSHLINSRFVLVDINAFLFLGLVFFFLNRSNKISGVSLKKQKYPWKFPSCLAPSYRRLPWTKPRSRAAALPRLKPTEGSPSFFFEGGLKSHQRRDRLTRSVTGVGGPSRSWPRYTSTASSSRMPGFGGFYEVMPGNGKE